MKVKVLIPLFISIAIFTISLFNVKGGTGGSGAGLKD